MTPWPPHRPKRAYLLLLPAALSVGLVVSCVSVARTPGAAMLPPATAGSATARVEPTVSPASDARSRLAAGVLPSPGLLAATAPVATQRPVPVATQRPTPALDPAPTPWADSSSVPPSPAIPPSATRAPTHIASPSAPASPDGQAGPSLDDATLDRLAAILERTTGKGRVAGLQVAVRLSDGQTWLGSSGEAQFLPDRPVEDDTVFSVASITKTFIAALILQLAEEGKLDLDVPFGRYWQDAPRKDSVTIRQLLSHTSGIYNYFEHPRYAAISRAWLRPVSAEGLASREHAWTYDEIMGLVKTGYCRAGECYHYSNTNYVILGRIAETVGGAPLHEQLRQRFFDPLGMTSTYYQPAEVPPADAAHGHWDYGTGYSDHTRDARVLPFEAALTVADAAGAIASTARDLSIWADALYGGRVLSSASLAQMTTMLEPGLYGLGTDVAVFAGKRAYGHRGGLRGFESSMWYFPHAGVTIALLSNQGNWLTDVPMEKLATAVFGKAG